MSNRVPKVSRPPKRSRDDETGQLLVSSGQLLVQTGTAVEALSLEDAAELASKISGTTITAGAGYPRFATARGFRLAVLEAFVEGGPAYSEMALTSLTQEIQRLEDGRSEFFEPEDIPVLIQTVADEHQRAMARDNDLPLRLYALWRMQAIVGAWEREKAEAEHDGLPDPLKPVDVDRAEEVLDRVREREQKINDEWVRIVRTLASDLGAAPLDDLDYTEFEIALTAFRNGLIMRQATTGIPEGTLARLVSSFVLGFFEDAREEGERQSTLTEKLTELLRPNATSVHGELSQMPRKGALRELAAEARRRLSSISDEDVATSGRPNVRRALATLRDQGTHL